MLHAWALWALAHDSGNGSGPVDNTGRPSATSMDDAEVPGLILTCGKPQTHCPNWQWTSGKPPVGFQLHLWMMQRPPSWQGPVGNHQHTAHNGSGPVENHGSRFSHGLARGLRKTTDQPSASLAGAAWGCTKSKWACGEPPLRYCQRRPQTCGTVDEQANRHYEPLNRQTVECLCCQCGR